VKIRLKSKKEISSLREAGRIVTRILEELKEKICPGISTKALDEEARRLIKKYKVKPAFLGYRGYPAVVCTSVNSQVVHGIPGERKLVEGDLISLDIGIKYGDYYGDRAISVIVGKGSKSAEKLLKVTKEALQRAISQVQVNHRIGDISWAIQSYVEKEGFSVVRDYSGHGIGRELHEDPLVPNFGLPSQGVKLEPGLVLAIETMVNQGNWAVEVLPDGWTVVTSDGSLSAHFEEMVALGEEGVEVLTGING
jgi:methionyl aminopeptidase